jgi:hypothetical protein
MYRTITTDINASFPWLTAPTLWLPLPGCLLRVAIIAIPILPCLDIEILPSPPRLQIFCEFFFLIAIPADLHLLDLGDFWFRLSSLVA